MGYVTECRCPGCFNACLFEHHDEQLYAICRRCHRAGCDHTTICHRGPACTMRDCIDTGCPTHA